MFSVSANNEFVEQYTISLNKLAKEKKIDDLIGRTKETEEIIKVFSRRNKNNAILVGNSGVGKTAIVKNLARLIEDGNVPPTLENKEIVMLDPMALVSGTHFRGMFEERIKGLFDELQANDKYILFIDDMHNVLKSGGKEKDGDISGAIGNILTEGTIRVIGTTTFRDYRNSFENNSQISRKMQKITIEPMTIEESIQVLEKNKKYYEKHHGVFYPQETIKKIVELADRYITDRSLPDSAFDVLDLSGAKTALVEREPIEIQNAKRRLKQIEVEKDDALNSGNFEKIDSLTIEEKVLSSDLADYKRDKRKTTLEPIEITETDVADVVSEITNIPVSKLTVNEKKKIANIDKALKDVVVGQDEAINEICKVIKRNRVGLNDKTHTNGVFLCLGKSGTGKTLLAKTIAKEVYGDEKALIRIDMSEYSEKNSVSKLHGTQPGYIGYDDGGVLTNAIKQKPYSVVLLDEIEKADESIYNLFLQVFDEGRLTESNGNLVDCHNCIFIMTSNLGTKKATELGGGVGFTNDETTNKKSIIEKELKRKFTPEFLNRINKIVYFNELTEDNLKNIVKLEINKLNNKLNNINYNIIYSNDVIDYIHVEAVKDKDFGARPIARLIQTNIEDKLTDLMLENDYEPNYVFSASCENGNIVVK
jgi:ATP-dependent Clp protease ATP-binding subunit ClpC